MQQAKSTKGSSGRFSPKRLWTAVRERIAQYGRRAVPAVKRLAGAAQKTAQRTGLDFARFREYAFRMVQVAFGFLMGIARLPQGIHPFGIAALCAFSDAKSVLFAYIGAALSCATYNSSALSTFIIYFFLYIARKAFTESRFGEPLYARVLESAAVSMAIGVVRLCAGGETPLYGYVAFLSLMGVAAAFTYFFTTLFTPSLQKAARISTRSICSYALMGALVCSLSGVQVLGFDLQLAAACLITLTYAVANGFMHAGIVGFVCGIACASPTASAALGLGGIAAALVFSKSVFASLFAFAAVFTVCGAYGTGLGYSVSAVPSVLVSCVLFFPACGFLPETLRLNAGARERAQAEVSSSGYEKELSEALFSLSDVFEKLAQKQKYPSFGDVALAVDKSFSDVCAKCALSEMCYARRKTDMKELKQTLFSVLSSRTAEPDDFGPHMNDKCIRLDRLCEQLNADYRILAVSCAKDNRTALLSSQYAGMARLILDGGQRSAEQASRDTAFEKSVAAAFDKADVPYGSIVTLSGREKRTRVTGIDLDRFPFSAGEFKRYLLVACGVRVSEPSFDISDKGGTVLSFERAPTLSVEYAQAGEPKQSGEVSGDTVSFLQSEKQYFYTMLCDGMGSGVGAATASRLSALFLEKMLAAGIKKSVILELLNNVLLAQSSESFSTVDLLEADLLTGRCSFVKAGAAPTYILRTGKLYKIFSATPPVGILSSFAAESTRFDVEPNDLILMLSDGVVPNGEDGAWLAELIRMDQTGDPATLAGRILEKAREINTRGDDMSVAVIRVKGQKAA